MLDGLIGHAPCAEACHHDTVRALEHRRVRIASQIQAVGFGQLQLSSCSYHAISTLPKGVRIILSPPNFVLMAFSELRMIPSLGSPFREGRAAVARDAWPWPSLARYGSGATLPSGAEEAAQGIVEKSKR